MNGGHEDGTGRAGRAPWFEGIALASLVALLLWLGGPSVRASYHGYLHTTVGEAVLREGLLPENPYHAGAPLRYYTLYPALGAGLGRLGFGALTGFALLNVLAALLFAPALDALGRSLGLAFRARRAAFFAAVFGFNALGWIGALLADPTPPGSPPVFALSGLTFRETPIAWDMRLQAFLPKFLNASSFAIALPFGLWALATARAGGRARAAVAPAALCLALNPLVGAFVGVLLAAAAAPRMLREPGREGRAWLFSGLAAVLLAAPFLIAALRGGAGPSHLVVEVAGSPLTNLLGPLALLLPCAAFGLRTLAAEARVRLVTGVVLAAIAAFAVTLPWGNEYKLARLGALFWALAAGPALARLWETRRALAVVLLLVAAPTTARTAQAYWRYGQDAPPPPLREAGAALEIEPTAFAVPVDAAFFTAEASLPGDTVVLVPPLVANRQLVQGHALAPLLVHPLLVDGPNVHNDREPDLFERLAAREAFYRPDLDAGQVEALRRFVPDRPLLILVPPGLRTPLAARLEEAGAVAQDAGPEWGAWLLPPFAP